MIQTAARYKIMLLDKQTFEHKLTTKFKKVAKLIELFHRFPSSIINIFLFMWDNFTIIISLVNRK